MSDSTRACALWIGVACGSTLGQDVPLELFTNAQYGPPHGVPLGEAIGISFGDYDGDGWIDLFVCESGNLWRNVDGQTWAFVTDVDSILPPTSTRYGSSFGDYDRDGLPDLAIEPRTDGGDSCFHLLRNLGGGMFVDVAGDPQVVDFQPCGASETMCWGDVDGDGEMDLFLPFYLPTDNRLLHNLGPTGPGGAHRFQEIGAAAGVKIPAGNARPEGAQLCDVDRDGDLDLYSNGALGGASHIEMSPGFHAALTDVRLRFASSLIARSHRSLRASARS